MNESPLSSGLRRTYYLLKPYLPWSVRVGLRRIRAQRQRRRFAEIWPVDPETGAKPANWHGWPDGKRFAFILTHDVEGRKGLERCEALAALESGLGFRSSFNFIPEGEYQVSESLRKRLVKDGFEIGVHDLKHDGKLYSTESNFHKSALRINHYIQEWNAVGFRSGFMHHNLSWIAKLKILYDASTFDSDPFEPQPDGVKSIFPFWVRGSDGSGYVEMPYTLVQDFTLFTILREKTIQLWTKKLDWICEHGGMALLNVHPDYVCFDGSAGRGEFVARLYSDLLQYVRNRYSGCVWTGLPRVAAEYAKLHREGLRQEIVFCA